jgi:pimeloyl-ACP methyl ester carboxylesterase/class 3 adenylate cyclase
MSPVTRYAKSGDIHVAYQVFGEGAIDLVLVPGFVSHIENYWTQPDLARWMLRLGGFSRVITFDKRGTGLSDRVGALPNMDERMDDVRAVMDAVGTECAALLGISEGGSLAMLFAASHPERCQALVLYGAFPRFAYWIPTREELEAFIEYIDHDWGTGATLPRFAPSRQGDAAFQQYWGRFERLGASPAAAIALMRMNSQIDVTDILPSIGVPTLVIHRTGDRVVNVEGGRLLAKRIPGAQYVELPGVDHLPSVGDSADEIIDLIQQFLTGSRSVTPPDRVLATVLFTDIVGATEKAAALGDRRWRDLLLEHHCVVRAQLDRFRGRELDTAGDGFLAAFDGPARAVRCASALVYELRPLGLQIRVGVHTGECELIGDKLGGIAVHIGARVAALARAGEVLVSGTVKDLVAGSGIEFQDRGIQVLKGVPGRWQLYAVARPNEESV